MTEEKKSHKEKAEEKEVARRKEALRGKYSQRITVAKNGRELFLKKDYVEAAKKYNEYLAILAEGQNAEDIYSLTPAKFNQQADMTEMLLISHIYWELSRIYEMTPKLQVTFDKCLKQFVRFTINQPYQVLNSEVLRKYIKKFRHSSKQIGALEKAYSQIQIESKKCYVATYAFNQEHWVTNELRRFKSSYLNNQLGAKFVSFYYKLSAPTVAFLSKHKFAGVIFKSLTIAPLIFAAIFSKVLGKL